jgi:hypothetical protein
MWGRLGMGAIRALRWFTAADPRHGGRREHAMRIPLAKYRLPNWSLLC